MPRTNRTHHATSIASKATVQRVLFAVCLVLFLLAVLCAAQGSPTASKKHATNAGSSNKKLALDGHWWAASSPEQRSGYVNGYEDCYVYDAKAKHNAGGWTANDYVQAVSEYYRAHSAEQATLVSAALKQVNITAKPRPVPKGGEEWKEPHGYYDGLWWRGSSEEEQLGYLEGYLSCYSSEGVSGAVAFSKTASEYRTRMNKYINAHPNSDEEKLASILRRLRDRASSR